MNIINKKNIIFRLIFLFLIVVFFPGMKVNAATDYFINAKATPKTCTIRTAPNEGGDWLLKNVVHWLDSGDKVTTIDGASPVVSNNSLCATQYYNVSYSGKAGYVCGDYIDFNVITTYNQYFKELGFPDDYLPYLNVLKTLHPTWNFIASKTGLNWDSVLDNESELGVSLISTNNDGWKSTNPGSYDYYTDTFKDNFDSAGWYAANRNIIAYYMDPRNFLNTTDIFMFQTLGNNKNESENIVKAILADTFMKDPYTDTDGLVRSYSETFMDAAELSGVSPYLLASRVKQEVGIGTSGYSSIVSGNVVNYPNIFNYFNYGAYTERDERGNVKIDAITNGLIYAKSNNWNTRYGSIIGGSKKLGAGYINLDPNGLLNQDTLYLQKWDLVGELYSHQYMTNIMAPKSEGRSIYNAYAALKVIEEEGFTFKIPVYEKMPVLSVLIPSTGSPNNYLKNLTIDGVTIPGFDGGVTDYTYYVSGLANNVNISGTVINTKATIGGLGNVSLPTLEKIVTLRVTAENGSLRDYRIKIVRSDVAPISVIELANSIGVKNNGTYMTGIAIGTNVNTLIDKTKQLNNLATVVIKNINGESISNIGFKTGDKVSISINNETKEYIIIIYGDSNGDGSIGIADLLRTQKKILNQIDLSEAYTKAADVNHDGRIDISDLLKIQKKILGITEIDQSGGVI